MFRNDTCLAVREQCQGSELHSRGRHLGPTALSSGGPRKVDDAEHIATARRMKADGHTGKDIAKYLGVRRATLYRYLTEDTAA
jgi:DNA invertase Pin-like site-specific DNA recombinase